MRIACGLLGAVIVLIGCLALPARADAETVQPCRTGRPVVLVHGAGADAATSFSVLAPLLRTDGFCVHAPNYGAAAGLLGRTTWGTADLRSSAAELQRVFDAVRGAGQVDVVAHSAGGTAVRYLIASGYRGVHALVALGAPNQGTTFGGLRRTYPDLALLGLRNEQIARQVFGVAGAQLLPGSPMSGLEVVAGVEYTMIATRTDEVVTPPESALLPGARNIWLQDGCPHLRTTHSALLAEPRALHHVRAALDPSAAGRSAPC